MQVITEFLAGQDEIKHANILVVADPKICDALNAISAPMVSVEDIPAIPKQASPFWQGALHPSI